MPPRKKKNTSRPRRTKVNKTKLLVTGHGPTYLERIAQGATGVSAVARAVMPIVSAINTESKYYDSQVNGVAYNPGTNDAIINLTAGIAQGLTDQARIGNSVLAQNLAIKLMMTQTFTTLTSQARMARITLLCWKENIQSNPPTAAKIFEFPTLLHSAFNKDYTDQMVIIKDKIIPMNSTVLAGLVQSGKYIKIFKKLDFHLRWQAGAVTDGTVNHVFLVIRGNGPGVAEQTNYDVYHRLNYTDN